jgi:Ca2+-dependent lipid-binding protein
MDPSQVEVWISVHVVSATSLPKMDSGFGKIDAYVVLVDSEGKKHQTPVIKSNYDPVWDHKVSCFLYVVGF